MNGDFGSVDYILKQLGLSAAKTKKALEDGSHVKAFAPPPDRNTGEFVLEIPVGRRGVELTAAQCKLFATHARLLQEFAQRGKAMNVSTSYGALQAVNVNGVRVIECRTNHGGRPLRMTREKVASVLKYLVEIRRFAKEAK